MMIIHDVYGIKNYLQQLKNYIKEINHVKRIDHIYIRLLYMLLYLNNLIT